MTSAVGFPLETVYDITDITQGDPGIVTLAEVSRDYALSVAEGQTVGLHNIRGMVQLNTVHAYVTNFDADAKTFELYDLYGFKIDTTSLSPYTLGGQIDIISFPGTPPGLMFNND